MFLQNQMCPHVFTFNGRRDQAYGRLDLLCHILELICPAAGHQEQREGVGLLSSDRLILQSLVITRHHQSQVLSTPSHKGKADDADANPIQIYPVKCPHDPRIFGMTKL